MPFELMALYLVGVFLGGPFRWLMQVGALSPFTTGLTLRPGWQPSESANRSWVGGCAWRSPARWQSHATPPLMRLELRPDDLRIGPSTRLLSTVIPTFTIPRDGVTAIQPQRSRTRIETVHGYFIFSTAPTQDLTRWWHMAGPA